jgi:uncharacterized protein YjbI with pentapeptide repeats
MQDDNLITRWQSEPFRRTAAPWLAEILRRGENSAPRDLRGLVLSDTAPPEWFFSGGLRGVRLADVDLRRARLSLALDQATFQRVRLGEATLTACRLNGAGFFDCSFDGAVLAAACDEVRFEGCSFVGARLDCLPDSAFCGGVRSLFQRCNFGGTLFARVRLVGARFVDCQFGDARFDGCDLQEARFYGNVPDLPQFAGCKLTGVRFSYEVSPAG